MQRLSISRAIGPAGQFMRAALCLLLVPVAFGFTELAVWCFKGVGPARKDVVKTDYMPTKLRSNYRGEVLGLPFVTNRYGFRGEADFDLSPPANQVRVLALGDSVGVGLGLRPSESYVKVAERRLNQLSGSGRKYHLVNAGGQGYSPSSYYAYLTHEGLQFSPSMVIVQIELCNDVTDEALLAWERNENRPKRVLGGRYVVAWDGNLLGTVARGNGMLERTYTYTLVLRRALDAAFQWFPRGPFQTEPGVTYFHLGFDRFALTDEAIERGWHQLFASLAVTRQLCQQNQIAFLLMILPSRFVFDGEAPDRREFAAGLLRRAEQMAVERGIPYQLFTENLARQGGAELFFDFAHLTEYGSRIVGENLARHVIRSRIFETGDRRRGVALRNLRD